MADITQIISSLDPMPDVADPATFEDRMNGALTVNLPRLRTELNVLASQINAVAEEFGANAGMVAANIGAINAAPAAAAAALAALDAFDDRYLGAKAADPSLDNDGAALIVGATYWNSVTSTMRVWGGAVWMDYQAGPAANAAAALASKNAAATSETNSITGAATATAKALEASNYAAAAATGAKFYDTIALGRAAVADTFTFGVKAGGSDALTRPSIYRRDSSTTQTLLYAVVPATEYDASFSAATAALLDGLLVLEDPVTGNAIFRIKTDGMPDSIPMRALVANVATSLATGVALSALLEDRSSLLSDSVFAVEDPTTGNAIFKVLKTGALDSLTIRSLQASVTTNSASITKLTKMDLLYEFELEHLLTYGQSLSIGISSGQAPISTTQPYGSVMLSGGIRTANRAPYTGETFAPLIESSADGIGVETPLAGAAEMVNQLILAEHGLTYTQHNWRIVGSAAGGNGSSIAALGSTVGAGYTGLLASIDKIAALALAGSNPYVCKSFFWIQGEADTSGGLSRAAYVTALNALYANLNTDIKARTGQTETVALLSYQTACHATYSKPPDIALAHTDVADGVTKFIVTPMYHFNYVDAVHLMPESYKWMGAYFGLAYKRLFLDKKGWKWLKPLRKIVLGSAAIVTFDVPVQPLVFDTSTVTNPGNYGFTLVDSGGSPLTVSSVELAGPNRVKINAAAPIPAGAKVRYAYDCTPGANSGPLTGARGNLRDSAGDSLSITIQNVAKRLDNWCVIFEI